MSSIIKTNIINFKVRDVSKNGVIKSYKDNLENFNIKTSDDKYKNNMTYARSVEDKGKSHKEKVINTKKELLSNNSYNLQTNNNRNIKSENNNKLKEIKNKNNRHYLSRKVVQNTEKSIDKYLLEEEDLGIESIVKTKQSIRSSMILNKKRIAINKQIGQNINKVIKGNTTNNFYKKSANSVSSVNGASSVGGINRKTFSHKSNKNIASALRKKQKREITLKARKKANQEVAKGIRAIVVGIKNLLVSLITKKVAIIGFLILVLFITIVNSIIGIMSFLAFSGNMSLDDSQSFIAEYLTKKDYEINSQIEKVRDTYKDYDEYIFTVPSRANTNQDLVYAFLKAKYGNDKLSDDVIKAEIDVIHNKLYDLQFTTSTKVVDIVENGETKQTTKNILTITLISKTFADYYSENKDELLSKKQQKEYDNIVAMLKENIGKTLKNPFPTENWQNLISSEYGYRNNPTGVGLNFHTGLDLAMPFGTEIHASMSGTAEVINLGDRSYGLHVIITNGKYKTIYGHCSSVLVQNGQYVTAGEVIAKVGSTGNSTGPHLHLEYRVNNQCKNPKVYLQRVK